MKLKSFLLFIFSSALCVSANAQNLRNMTAEELKGMVDRHAKVVLIDARSEEEYRLGHSPGAINIPGHKLYLMEKLLPKNRKTPVVFYCRGVG